MAGYDWVFFKLIISFLEFEVIIRGRTYLHNVCEFDSFNYINPSIPCFRFITYGMNKF